MLSINFIRENIEFVKERLLIKNFDAEKILSDIIKVDKKRRETQKELDDNLSKANSLAREIGDLFKAGEKEEAEKAKEKTSQLKSQNKDLQKELESLKKEQENLLIQLPNIPHKLVPAGKSEENNEIVYEADIACETAGKAMPHWELATKYDIIDFDLGSKITGSGFPLYKGKGAILQRALIKFFLDKAMEAGYTEYLVPLMVNKDSAFGTGQLPDKDGQMYHIVADNLFAIPTSEVPLTNIFRDVILKEEELPVKCTAYSTCFRREAGSHGKDVRGLNRLHQFDKVEIVQIVKPEESYKVLDEMVDYVKSLLSFFKMPFRISRLCGGDLGFAAAMTYDFEVFSPAQNKWLEISSVSNFESFQANRMKLRYKNDKGANTFAHTLNGSALALPRLIAALMENYQSEKGIIIPEFLIPYTGFEIID